MKQPDGSGKGYMLTPLGCLVNGPWQVRTRGEGHYNRALYLDNKEISSKREPYSAKQKDLIFELHKDRTITYWLKSENNISDTAGTSGIKKIERKPTGYGDVTKLYTKGYWDVNFEEQTILIHFGEGNIPDFRFKYRNLGNSFVNFQEISYFDCIYKGNKVSIKKINSMYYERLYPRF